MVVERLAGQYGHPVCVKCIRMYRRIQKSVSTELSPLNTHQYFSAVLKHSLHRKSIVWCLQWWIAVLMSLICKNVLLSDRRKTMCSCWVYKQSEKDLWLEKLAVWKSQCWTQGLFVSTTVQISLHTCRWRKTANVDKGSKQERLQSIIQVAGKLLPNLIFI